MSPHPTPIVETCPDWCSPTLCTFAAGGEHRSRPYLIEAGRSRVTSCLVQSPGRGGRPATPLLVLMTSQVGLPGLAACLTPDQARDFADDVVGLVDLVVENLLGAGQVNGAAT